MNDRGTLVELPELQEGVDVEAKKAAGKDGEGELPRSFFESYSAMANTYGGTIYLGVEQRDDSFYVHGIRDVARVRKNLWDRLNNPEVVSRNLLRDEHVTVERFGEHNVLRVVVPRAARRERPVYVGKNPLVGTYRRNYEGDYRCDEETVRRMLAEQLEDSRDQRLLTGFGFDDLELSTVKVYRQRFTVLRVDHPWNELDDHEFMRVLGALQTDRQTGAQGLTLAGLLMFGKWRSITDEVPHYFLDYQEQASSDPDVRWTDRVVPDGTWSGNVYDFYRLVMPKLTAGLKVPFRLQDGTQRIDESSVHEALREALVNALIHADFSGRSAVRVLKRPDMFEFRNPGLMRVSLEEALQGGHSDCRNRVMQKMFQLVGLGDQAGSGIPKVYRGWRQQDWRQPELQEFTSPSDHTVLTLRMISLYPADVMAKLQAALGDDFGSLSELARLVLVTVVEEGVVTHARIKSMTSVHSRDLTMELQALVRRGLLTAEGVGRGMSYRLPRGEGLAHPSLFDLLSEEDGGPSWRQYAHGALEAAREGDSGTNEGNSGTNEGDSGTNEGNSGTTEADVHDELSQRDPTVWARLLARAAPARERRRLSPDEMNALILELCADQWLTMRDLEALLGRKERVLRKYLGELMDSHRLQLLYPASRNHPQQAYRASAAGAQP